MQAQLLSHLKGSLEAGVSPQSWPRRVECGTDVTAAPGNVLHSSSWQWSGGFQQEWSSTASKKEKTRGGKEQFIIKLLWRRHFYTEPTLKLESDVLHSDTARMLNTLINDCNSWTVRVFLLNLNFETLSLRIMEKQLLVADILTMKSSFLSVKWKKGTLIHRCF